MNTIFDHFDDIIAGILVLGSFACYLLTRAEAFIAILSAAAGYAFGKLYGKNGKAG